VGVDDGDVTEVANSKGKKGRISYVKVTKLSEGHIAGWYPDVYLTKGLRYNGSLE